MVQITGIDHVVLHVSDLERSKKFYMSVLGMTVEHEFPGHSFLHCGRQAIALFEVKDGEGFLPGHDMDHMAFQTDQGTYESIKAELKRKGVAVSGREGEAHCIYFDDPDGHRLQISLPKVS